VIHYNCSKCICIFQNVKNTHLNCEFDTPMCDVMATRCRFELKFNFPPLKAPFTKRELLIFITLYFNQVVFVFVNGLGNNLAAKIESFGIRVEGARLRDVDIDEDDDVDTTSFVQREKSDDINNSNLSTPDISHITKINLDVSAMLAYVSSVCNGSASLYEFSVRVLAQQAEWERLRPQKPILDEFFKGIIDSEKCCN
jgi:hypothetical protein